MTTAELNAQHDANCDRILSLLLAGVPLNQLNERKTGPARQHCVVPWCKLRLSQCGMCSTHYRRYMAYGDPLRYQLQRVGLGRVLVRETEAGWEEISQ